MIYIIGLGIVGLAIFLFLQPKFKVLISYIWMMQFLDVAPKLVFGVYAWDYGAILMLLTATQVFVMKPVTYPGKHTYLTVLKIFFVWLLICFAWSLFIYDYPLMHTIKNARSLIVGYMMIFIFIRLFSVQPESFRFLMKWFYWLTLLLMPVVILQYVLQKQLLFGLIVEYQGDLRAVPIFLPFCLLNFWIILTKVLTGEKQEFHETVYLFLALLVVALSFTRGIYISVLITGLVLILNLFRDKALKIAILPKVAVAGILIGALFFVSGLGQKVVGRAFTALEILVSGSSSERITEDSKKNDDTFSGRIGLAEERFALVMEKNPVVGFGFIHEDDVPSDLRSSLRYGTALGGTADDPQAYSRTYAFSGHYILGFYTADIAWADLVISSGLVGIVLIICFIVSFAFGHLGNRSGEHPMGYAVKTGLFLQIVQTFMLTFNGNTLYGAVHIPAFLLAGYAMTKQAQKAVVVKIA
jgi:hypothetical protein